MRLQVTAMGSFALSVMDIRLARRMGGVDCALELFKHQRAAYDANRPKVIFLHWTNAKIPFDFHTHQAPPVGGRSLP